MYIGNAGNAGAGAGRCQFTFQTLHATSHDGSSLESAAATAGRESNIQDAGGRGLFSGSKQQDKRTLGQNGVLSFLPNFSC